VQATIRRSRSHGGQRAMAIARVFEGKGWTPGDYDKLIAALLDRLGRGERAAPGVLFHWVTATADGMRATDVYESRDAADTLVQEHIGPIAGELGLALPDISEYEVHRFLAP
jgi:hypothetical protein